MPRQRQRNSCCRALRQVVFVPTLHSASLWDLAHNRTHHRYNNVGGWGHVWEPMTEDAYLRCKRLRCTIDRFYRRSDRDEVPRPGRDLGAAIDRRPRASSDA
jgi:hypothetical protein